jgi:NADH-quinone oxidoreductase subunit J
VTGVEVLFLLLGAVAVGAALLVVSSRNLVHAALWLVVTLGALAGCYLLLTAELVAWVQVLIYVGAVVVLLLFGLMLTRAPIGYSAEFTSGNRWVAAGVAGATAGVLVTVVGQAFGDAYVDVQAGVAGSSGAMGSAIFRYWVLPFEALSVLLLAALVGAIVLSRGGTAGTGPDGADSGEAGADPSDRATAVAREGER